ncbi:MAG: SoxR reducing system RseC family protein [Acidaminococcaceae bacterium]|nr:SoxR reducing system RseC family protein [Acidaminococcaceae bacterium]
MAEIRGVVVKKQGERAEIKVDKAESELTGLPKYLDCWNPVNAKPGERVGAEFRDFDDRKAKLIVYGLPLTGILAGYAFGHSLATFFHSDSNYFVIGGIIVWLIVTCSYAYIFNRDAVRKGKQPVIYEIEAEKLVIDMSKKD